MLLVTRHPQHQADSMDKCHDEACEKVEISESGRGGPNFMGRFGQTRRALGLETEHHAPVFQILYSSVSV
jgi:hypothetical protein